MILFFVAIYWQRLAAYVFYSLALVVDMGGYLLYCYYRRLIIVPPLSLAFDVPDVFEFVIFIISCVSMADGDGALDVLVPLFPST